MRRFVRRRWFVLSLLGAVGLMLVAVGAKAGSKPEPVLFHVELTMAGPDIATGTFEASGAITDDGSATEWFRFSPPGEKAPRTAHGTKLLEGENGTITMKFQVRVAPGQEEGTQVATGRWVIISGTGDYENLHGAGEASALIDLRETPPTIVADYTGIAVLDNGK